MTSTVATIRHCIERCAGTADKRARGQLQRRCAEALARTGDVRIAADVAAAARRVGEFISTLGVKAA